MNARLKSLSDECLNQAVAEFERTNEPQRHFVAFEYQAATWPEPRWVEVKCEANAQGTNRRAIVTNRSGARVLPAAAYDEYTERGESENRNKELKRGLCADRLSCHRFMANYFRLYLHCLAANMLARLRHVVAHPPKPQIPTDTAAAQVAANSAALNGPEQAAAAAASISAPLPASQLAGRDRQQFFNQRRDADPLGEGQPCTWRRLLFKVAAEIVVSTRRVMVRLSGSWPFLPFYREVSAAVATYIATLNAG
jgi:hypothetical protein